MRSILRRPWPVIIVVGIAFLGWKALSDRQQEYEVQAAFDSAVNLTTGLDVQMRGVDVGKVAGVRYEDGKAIVSIGVSDDRVFPLRRGTKATIRYGTTVGIGTRYVELLPGPKDAPSIPDGGTIASKDVTTPVELDEVFNTLNPETRERLTSLVGNSADVTAGRSKELNRGLRTLPGGVRTTGDVMGDLLADEQAIRALVVNGERVSRTLVSRTGAISETITAARRTLDAFGNSADGVRASIDGLAPTFRQARSTLRRADGSLEKVRTLIRAVEPGAKRIPALARAARPALVRLQQVTPVALATLRTTRDGAPAVTELLDKGRTTLPAAGTAMKTANPMLACVRAYVPEIAGMLGTWGGATKNYDDRGHFGRIFVREGVTSLNGLIPDAALPTLLGHKFAMPRPPGLNAGAVHYPEECEVSADALDPTKDVEAVR
ncbi:MAG: MlaD family protein [Solirubrobacteraceae bacterium]